ncbi:ribonuclease [Weissella oryzae SG25]|uniref:Ribonuclease M5 n=1 Tax=Weissella oryzae (strain DSM 25784 / JCM 18191 / LMG 30913 / SG25) TaxID=1329250 RepID=A0A069D338_WEIOS|nr:ribonuclease M5 [Weissella oryzae]GAK31781.1 ribonuclease [Weissella oryzae SG25]
MEKIKEVIVVEGKADTAVIQRFVAADTLETNGSALSDKTIMAIKEAAQRRGVIVFTDPDFNGERLRKLITAAVPTAKHAFLTKNEAGRLIPHHSLGIEYADQAAIEQALAKVYTPHEVDLISDITQHDLLQAGLIGGANAAKRRTFVAERLKLGYVNGKQLLKRLQMFGIKGDELQIVLKELED